MWDKEKRSVLVFLFCLLGLLLLNIVLLLLLLILLQPSCSSYGTYIVLDIGDDNEDRLLVLEEDIRRWYVMGGDQFHWQSKRVWSAGKGSWALGCGGGGQEMGRHEGGYGLLVLMEEGGLLVMVAAPKVVTSVDATQDVALLTAPRQPVDLPPLF